jgi:hypothetical protein
MGSGTTIYGYSRGYRFLVILSVVAIMITGVLVTESRGIDPIALAGLIGFSALFLYSWNRASRRVAVATIGEDGFSIKDPALLIGSIAFEEIEEIRIYAMRAHPTVAFRLHTPDLVRRRAPTLVRVTLRPVWLVRHYQIVLQLDNLDDQIAAIKSVAAKHGIPIRSELI